MVPSTSVLQKSNVTALSGISWLTAPKPHGLEDEIELVDGPARIFPRALLHLVLPVGIDAAALDATAQPPLFVRERRRRQRLTEQVLEPVEPERHLLLATR